MHDHEPQEISEESLAKGYEQEDISLPTVFRWARYLIGFTVAVSGIVYLVYRLYVPDQPPRPGYSWNSAARQGDPNRENIPQIQAEPMKDIKTLRTEEYIKENQYAHWQDDDHKTVLRIKLSKAMEIIKQRGVLPVAGPAPKMGTNSAPTPSNPPPAPPTTTPPGGGTAPLGNPSNATPTPSTTTTPERGTTPQ